MKILTSYLFPVLSSVFLLYGFSFAQSQQILSTSPYMNELNVPVNKNISGTFDTDMNQSTFTNATLTVYSQNMGYLAGIFEYDKQSKTVTFTPAKTYGFGETITVTITTGVKSSSGNNLDKPYIWSFTTEVSGGNGIYTNYTAHLVGDYPTSITSGDFDQDGDYDLAAANWNGRSISVLLNIGNGIFSPQTVYKVGTAFAVTAGDLDRDGDIDLAVASDGHDVVSILINKGDGTFITGTTFVCGNNPASVFAADYNGDGYLDLATANVLSHDVSILLNKGDGTFSSHATFAVYNYPRSIYAADLDGDGDFDLTTSHSEQDMISVLFNKGDGSFGSYSNYATDDGPSSVIAADLDQDMDMDLISSNVYHSDNVSIFLNNGDGTFATRTDYRAGLDPGTVSAGDFDNDGDLDLSTCGGYGKFVTINFNNGDGTFSSPSSSLEGYRSFAMIAVDIDGDGDLDQAGVISGFDSLCVIYHGDSPNTITDIIDTPENYHLDQNYPNPFNPVTTIKYQIPKMSDVLLSIYNSLGQKVTTLVNKQQPAGYYNVTWDAGNLASGVYFYLIEAESFRQIRKMLLIK